MKTRGKLTTILEQIYAPEPNEERWLNGVCQAATAAFDGHIGTQALTAELKPEGSIAFGSMAGDAWAHEGMIRAHAIADPATIRKVYLSGPVPNIGRIIKQIESEAVRKGLQQHAADEGGNSVTLAVGTDTSGRACILTFIRQGPDRLPAPTRHALTRLAGHLIAGYRLRGRPEERACAVLDPMGKVLGASAGAIADEFGPALRDAALAIDRARQREPADQERALGTWKAMVEGRFTLVERFESDGRRVFVAQANEPATRRRHALSLTERTVVAMAALSHPSKLIAYELGLAESTISGLLASALRKLGVRTRAELIEVHGALAGHGSAEPAEH
jgi:DNA-binding CsgD family transcriptional regulator